MELSTLVNVSLVMQVAILVLLFIGNGFAYKRKYVVHGWIMVTAVVLHTTSILSVMIPSLIESSSLLGELTSAGIVTWSHVLSGILAEILGVASIAWWGVQRKKHLSPPSRFGRKWVMRLIFIVWLIAVLSGIIVHVFYI